MRYRPAIIGYGVVGQAMETLFPDAVVYDTAPEHRADRDAVNDCDIAFVCVPTPANADGSCDISAVAESVAWLQTPLIVIRSTVPPGTTQSLAAQYEKRLIFQPEYLGETASHPLADPKKHEFIVLGGDPADSAQVADLYSRGYHASVRFFFTDSVTAELAKYMGNAFFATKVLFCAEFRKIAEAFGVDYPRLREIWLADNRISPDHTFAFPEEPGFGGKCLPKDLLAIIDSANSNGYDAEFLRAVHEINARVAGGSGPD